MAQTRWLDEIAFLQEGEEPSIHKFLDDLVMDFILFENVSGSGPQVVFEPGLQEEGF